MDDKTRNLLRASLESSWAAGDDSHPERIVNSFRERLPQFQKYYGPIPEDEIDELIEAFFKDYIPDIDPEPVAVTSTPSPTVATLDQGPRIKPVKTAPEPSEEALRKVTTGDKEMDDLVKELSKPEPKKRIQQPGKRQAKKEYLKGTIMLWLNRDARTRRNGYRVSQLCEEIGQLESMDEETVRRYAMELYKAGQIKMWKKPVILPGGKKVWWHLFTSATNPSEQFTFWVTK